MQMTADEMRSSDWSSDVCSSDLLGLGVGGVHAQAKPGAGRAPAKAREGAPNIIFIMTDDQAQGALSAYGNKILKTPNMARIVNEGIRFNKSFVPNSVCAASRASYLTGLYAKRYDLTSNRTEPGWYEKLGLTHSQQTPTSKDKWRGGKK